MKLTQLLKPWLSQQITDCDITDIKNDSRLVKAGDLFVAYPGAASDGRMFIENALSLGAVAVVYEPKNLPPTCLLPSHIPCVAISDLAERLATLAQRFYDNPSHSLMVTGVTGTNGKTTIAYQLAQAHALLQKKAAYIGTIGQGHVERLEPLNNTTPDALCLQKMLHDYVKQGIQQVCMEVSSHALSQHRVDGVEFKQALFTNLTLDHLDYHHTMEAYAHAKAQLFAKEHLEWVIINRDDAYSKLMLQVVKPHVKCLTYGLGEGCDVRADHWHTNINGTRMMVDSPWGKHQITIKALGRFNIYNALAVFSSLMAFGYSVVDVIKVMAELKAAPGRLEVVASAPYILVDYAHTPDALENVLTTLRDLKQGDLWVIFGCGGDRDKTKRPIMGRTASLYADRIIVTSDNPRSEDPEQIIREIVDGIPSLAKTVQRVNREEAIAYAINNAQKEDIILIAGKGHEAYQQIGSTKYEFSDKLVAKKLIKSLV